MDATYAPQQAVQLELSFIVSSFGGDEKTISGIRCDAPLSDLIGAVGVAFELPQDEVKLLNASGDVLPRDHTPRELGLEDGSHLLVMRIENDDFDEDWCEEGMHIDGGKVVVKQGGRDLTSVRGKAVVAQGSRRWRVRVDNDTGNLMIGVAHADVPLSFSQDEWEASYAGSRPTFPHVGKLAFVKSNGNTTPCWGAWDIQKDDIITVTVDVDQGVVAFEKNCVSLDATSHYPWTGIEGPVTLFVTMDYIKDQVTILEE
eukprot:TRINITY_DN7618_c0_g1_i1.p1 TRINITY_DN7618_c0_g1~~TRINITY_DN7618_c0_g1_i1.p1  ORF type:complete len:279 (-),score=42.48 TRINITY_DN7618_c0_g1_i1:257-1030(-)